MTTDLRYLRDGFHKQVRATIAERQRAGTTTSAEVAVWDHAAFSAAMNPRADADARVAVLYGLPVVEDATLATDTIVVREVAR